MILDYSRKTLVVAISKGRNYIFWSSSASLATDIWIPL